MAIRAFPYFSRCHSRAKFIFGGLLAAWIALTPARLQATGAGDVDTSFGLNGAYTLPTPAFTTGAATCMAVQPDGKIVVAGVQVPGHIGLRVLRLLPTGALDTTFGSNGVFSTIIGAGDNTISGVTVLANGQILLCGTATYHEFMVLRLTAGGKMDLSFGNSGVARTPIGTSAVASGMVVQADGKIVVAGTSQDSGYHPSLAVVRYWPNGLPDTTFASQGLYHPVIPSSVVGKAADTNAYAIALQSDQKIVIAGAVVQDQDADFILVRLSSNGHPDATFGTAFQQALGGGVVITPLGSGTSDEALAMALQSDGKIVVAGHSDDDTAVVRYATDGTLDTSFGSSGITTARLSSSGGDSPHGMALHTGGKIVIAGFSQAAGRMQVARFTTSGALDATFGSGGKTTTQVLATSGANAVAMDDKDNPIVAGFATSAPYETFAVVRYLGGAPTLDLATVTELNPTSVKLGITATSSESLTGMALQYGLSATAMTQQMTFSASGSSFTPSADLSFLTPNTTYYLRWTATNATGTGHSAVLTIKTPAAIPASVPVAVTGAATALTLTGATLAGTVTPKSGNPATVRFEWGLTTAYGNVQAASPATISGTTAAGVTASLTGLPVHTTYHYRVSAASTGGLSLGADHTFKTLDNPPVAAADTFLLTPSGKFTLNVLANDSDPDHDTLSLAGFTKPPAAQATVTQSGNALIVTTTTAFTGTSFTYTLSDGAGGTSTGSVTLTQGSVVLDTSMDTIPSPAQNYSLGVTSDALSFAVVESLTWLSATIDPGSGAHRTVTIHVLANTGKTSRSGTLVVGGQSFFLTQAGVEAVTDLTLPASPPAAAVSAPYFLPLVVTPAGMNPPTLTLSAGVLPPGLKLTTATTSIDGIPSNAGHYAFTVKATNAWGSLTRSFTLDVAALPNGMAGGFSGLIDRDAQFNQTLGGVLTLSITGTGTFSGAIVLGTATTKLSGRIDTDHFTLSIPRAKDLTPFAVTGTYASGTFITKITGDAGHEVDFTCHRTVGLAVEMPAKIAGLYTARIFMPQPAINPLSPRGDGFLLLSVAATTGATTWSGQLPDGTAVSGSSALRLDGGVNVLQMLYTGHGSVFGPLSLTAPEPPAVAGDPILTLATLAGSLNWSKDVPTARAYPAITPTDGYYLVHGTSYVAPAAGERVMGAAHAVSPASNASLGFTLGGIDAVADYAQLSQSFLITDKNAAVFKTGADNTTGLKFTVLTPSTGYFAGTFTLHSDLSLLPPGTATVARSAAFYGVFFGHEPGATSGGTGHVLLSALPTVASQTTATTPQTSCLMTVTVP